ncbi:MAG: helix-turn-helix transcriptional regulator [Clostridia bacterium]|nr:helix-turn-helix transcriptional regulator [Clostridia bacterium]
MSNPSKINNDFPRIITLLREERRLSQRKAAEELGISQPLLSHYEKGLRECGLDFVIKVADYYDVSTDYLLGRSAQRKSGEVVISDSPETEIIASHHGAKTAMINVLNKKLIINSLNIIFDLLDKIDNKGLSSESSIFLSSAVYSIFRTIYSSNPKNSHNIFSIPDHIYKTKNQALGIVALGNVENIASGAPVQEYRSVEQTKRPELSNEIITEEYGNLSGSLFTLIRNTEERLSLGKI